MQPVVSIIMATFNRAHFIEETLDSIIAQRFTAWECIIIDDGSTDTTPQLVENYVAQDSRFSYQRRSISYSKGLPGSRNNGLDLARGKFVIFFDDDDIVHPDNLFCCLKELETSDFDFCRYQREVFTDTFHNNFDRSLTYSHFTIDTTDLYKVLSNKLPFNSCAVMWRASCFENVRFKEDLMYAEEWELYNRLFANGLNGISIDKTLFYGRKHDKSNTGEFFQGNPVRVKSKSKAAQYLIDHFDRQKVIDSQIGMYMFSVMYRTGDRGIGKKVLKAKNLSTKDRLYLSMRYYLLPVSVPLGNFIKRRLKWR